MIFAGPSGNGKTELAHQLAMILNKPEDNCFIKIDCGKVTRMAEVFGLSGAYRGSTEGSALNNFVIQMSYKKDSLGIVLLDEIEKAKQSVIHGLYQVIDKGEWTNKKLFEGKGVQTETISCHNIIFIMNTNAADQCICDAASTAPQLYTSKSVDELEELQFSVEKTIRQKLQSTHPFTDAFMGRVGRIVPFFPMAKSSSNDADSHPLMGEMMTVAKILIEREQDSVTAVTRDRGAWASGVKQNMSSQTKDKMAKIIVRESVPEAGVRSIQKGVTAKMGKRILHSLLLEKGGIKDGSTVRYSATVDDSKVDFRVEEKPRSDVGAEELLDETFDAATETAGDY
jgi:ATP-dependent Clp protease ATP-binding subunit ClpA